MQWPRTKGAHIEGWRLTEKHRRYQFLYTTNKGKYEWKYYNEKLGCYYDPCLKLKASIF